MGDYSAQSRNAQPEYIPKNTSKENKTPNIKMYA